MIQSSKTESGMDQPSAAMHEELVHFAAARALREADPRRPVYHFTKHESNLHDPNGLCRWQGRWHLFYQAFRPCGGGIAWGHASSEDFLHWRDLPYALVPGPEKHCFSGSSLAEPGRVIAMYHGVGRGNMIAIAKDAELTHWEKLTGDAVIRGDSGSPDQPKTENSVFDPCIWKGTEFYYSLSGGQITHTASGKRLAEFYLYRSKDLVAWELVGPFLEGDRFTHIHDDGACPYFWPLGNRHILFMFSHHKGGQYLIGDYDEARGTFAPTAHGYANFGPPEFGGIHAPSACPDGKGGVVTIFNINGALRDGWDTVMSLPRRMRLDDAGQLSITPAVDTASLRTNHVSMDGMILEPHRETFIDGVFGDTLEIEMEVEEFDCSAFEIGLLRSPGGEECTRLTFYRGRGLRDWSIYTGWQDKAMQAASRGSIMALDNTHASLAPDFMPRPPVLAPVHVQPDEPLRLRIFIDRTVIEVFANDRQCAAIRAYPSRDDSRGVTLTARGARAKMVRLDAWRLNSPSSPASQR